MFPSAVAAVSLTAVAAVAAAVWWPAPLGGRLQCVRAGRLWLTQDRWHQLASGHSQVSMERLIMQKPDDELDGFVHACESQLLLRAAEAAGAAVLPVVAPADRLGTVCA